MDEAERRQDDTDGVLGTLSSYSVKKKKYILKQRIGSWIMQKVLTRGEKNLLKCLNMEYFH